MISPGIAVKIKKYFKPPPRIFGGATIWNNAFWRKTGELYRTKVWQNVFQLESYLQGEFQDKHVSNHQLECKPEVFYLLIKNRKKHHPATWWNLSTRITSNTGLWSICSKQNTLPEANIAMESPPFWWNLPGKMKFSWAMLVSGRVNKIAEPFPPQKNKQPSSKWPWDWKTNPYQHRQTLTRY